jgi:hypothetical protein
MERIAYQLLVTLLTAEGGTRTHTPLGEADFKCHISFNIAYHLLTIHSLNDPVNGWSLSM